MPNQQLLYLQADFVYMDLLPENFFVESFRFTDHVYHDRYPSINPSNASLSLKGKVVIITGASRGIGAKAFVPAFAEAGVDGLVLIATNAEKLKAVEADVKSMRPSTRVLTVSLDISNVNAVDLAFEKIGSVFGHADILVNNAAVLLEGEGSLIGDEDPENWWRQFEINTKGTFLISRAFLRQLRSTTSDATIITLVTLTAWKTFAHLSGYGISKGGALQISQHIAAGYPHVTAICLDPGLADTDMLMSQFRRFTRQSAELVGGLGVWLSHPHAKFLSGRTIASYWSVDDLVARKDEIIDKGLLQTVLLGKFDGKQFEKPFANERKDFDNTQTIYE